MAAPPFISHHWQLGLLEEITDSRIKAENIQHVAKAFCPHERKKTLKGDQEVVEEELV